MRKEKRTFFQSYFQRMVLSRKAQHEKKFNVINLLTQLLLKRIEEKKIAFGNM